MKFINIIKFVKELVPRRYLRDLEYPLQFFTHWEFYRDTTNVLSNS